LAHRSKFVSQKALTERYIPGQKNYNYREENRKEEVRMNIYIGDLSYDVTEDDLRQAFEGFGQVASATIIKDRYTGKSRGFGFVEMLIEDEAKAAISGMNGKEWKGRTLKVDEARPQKSR
jgi:RNA recognition motif-containing protein